MQEFKPGEIDIAVAFYRAIDDPTAKAVLDWLIDHPDERFDGAALVRHLQLSRHSDVARATYRLGGLAASLGRRRPWGEASLGYQMPADQATLFQTARVNAA